MTLMITTFLSLVLRLGFVSFPSPELATAIVLVRARRCEWLFEPFLLMAHAVANALCLSQPHGSGPFPREVRRSDLSPFQRFVFVFEIVQALGISHVPFPPHGYEHAPVR